MAHLAGLLILVISYTVAFAMLILRSRNDGEMPEPGSKKVKRPPGLVPYHPPTKGKTHEL